MSAWTARCCFQSCASRSARHLAFREVHGANLAAWRPGQPSAEFENFVADLGEMLASSADADPAPVEPEVEAPVVEPRLISSLPAASPPPAPEDTAGDGSILEEQGPPAPEPQPSVPAQPAAPAWLPEESAPQAGQGAATSSPPPVPNKSRAGRMIALAMLAIGAAGVGIYVMNRPPSESVQTFTDTLKGGSPCPFCPEMVVVPAGSFTMGSPSDEPDRDPDEGPQRTVTFSQPFAIGRYEVTFAHWDACVAAGGCAGYRPDDRSWGRGSRPVIDVSWNDAQEFVSWLSRQTGESYRLPTEAEWEYAARGGTATPFWMGATISTAQANYDGNFAYGQGVKGGYRQKTVAVDDPTFPANPFGLLHVHGNVLEWVQDCYAHSYDGAPSDGQEAVSRNDCSERVLRGGSWYTYPRNLRSAFRDGFAPVDRDSFIGFRVARMLTP